VPQGTDELAPELSEEDVRRLFDSVLVHIRDARHLDAQLWETVIAQSRNATLGAASAGLQRMECVLTGQSEVAQELQALYTLSQPGRQVLVGTTCSGCPRCRAMPESGGEDPFPSRPLVRPLQNCDISGLERWRDRFPALATSPVFILYDPTDQLLARQLEQLALRLRDCGMRELHVNRHDWPSMVDWQLLGQVAGGFVALTDLDEPADELAAVPRLTLLRHADAQVLLQLEQDGERPFDWIAVPSDIADPYRPDRRLADLRECAWLPAVIESFLSWAS
jgi:hypothetical protein